MDLHATVHRSVHEDSSEEDERLSPGAPSVDEENDSDKSTSNNSKKRKRGSYRCSRCGMPKRGHNCPDNFEGVHFAIVDTPSPGVQGGAGHMAPNGPPLPGFNLSAPGIPLDDCPRETLMMHLSTLHDDNMRLMQENARLHEMLQMQAHALNSMHPVEFHPGLAGPGPLPLPRPGGNGASPMVPQQQPQVPPAVSTAHRTGPLSPPVGAPFPIFAPAFANAQAPPHLMPPSQPSSAAPTPLAANRPTFNQNPIPTQVKSAAFPVGMPSTDGAPSAKRAKLEESFSPQFPGHPMMPHYAMAAGHFGQDMDHRAGHSFGRPIPATGDVSSNGFDYDYDRHDWLEDSDSSSEFYPAMDAPPTLIY